MQNNLDKFVKEKFQEQEFSFNESHWQGAVKLIEQNEKWRFWKSFSWAALGVALFFAGGIGGYWLSASTSTTATDTDTRREVARAHDNTLANTEQNNQLAIITQPNRPVTFGESPSASADVLHTTNIDVISNTQSNLSVVSASKTTSTQSPITSNDTSPNTSMEVKAAGTAEPSISESTKKAISKIETSQAEAIHKPVQQTTFDLSPVAQSIEMSPLKALSIDLADGFDQTQLTHPVLDQTPQRFFAGLTASTVHYASSGKHTGLQAGLSFKYKLSSQLSANADLLYHYRPGQFEPSAVVSDVRYSFGKSEIQSRLQASALHYIELPLYLQYQLDRHYIEAGVSASYLAGVRGELGQLTDLDQPGSAPLYQVEKSGWIDSEGFKKVNTQLMLGYQFGLTDRASIGLRANYTLGGIQQLAPQATPGIKQPSLYFNLSAKWLIF